MILMMFVRERERKRIREKREIIDFIFFVLVDAVCCVSICKNKRNLLFLFFYISFDFVFQFKNYYCVCFFSRILLCPLIRIHLIIENMKI